MKNLNQWYLHLFLILLSLSTVGVYFLFKNQTYFAFLIWNLFLAWIPYILAVIAQFIHTSTYMILRKIILIAVGLAWLLFLPNSPYVLTDFIHLTILKDSYVEKGALSFTYWYDFFVIFLFAWNGLLLGCSSMYIIQKIWKERFNPFVSWLIIVLTALLCGYGILLGREYRLNSWDAFHTERILEILRETLHQEAFVFCLLVGFVIMTVYVTFYVLVNSIGSSRHSSPYTNEKSRR
ncbi:DUF1361 domain-containing protein [Paenibacillus alginolyticus]|uniref:DUF1361 domain-containing protein n=1 Tax=Paenibacillus alginolyticus TaxID=59839 RepID=A0ABT4GBZ8_9BACL|nr:DUF1361 domain-containing protein [Paenibacillus alginolyticus]MCY9667447.1 DUF1361 domain-containing protein [Paenibacillus alginolyticus]MCY9693718.1 DUF1361 domain-containing protein [Paenibacillus alginolyticus]MEC0144569.1 DUF1361 domain-containing protein [Paenibacillus alginolyticus]